MKGIVYVKMFEIECIWALLETIKRSVITLDGIENAVIEGVLLRHNWHNLKLLRRWLNMSWKLQRTLTMSQSLCSPSKASSERQSDQAVRRVRPVPRDPRSVGEWNQ